MGLFGKREPCAICGGKVKGLLTNKVGGHLICDECYGRVDLADETLSGMTVDDFRNYMEFRRENQGLKKEFEVSKKIDFGLFGTKIVMDYKKHLFCFDPDLNTTIFSSKDVKSFTVKEDSELLFKATPSKIICYESDVPARVKALEPELMRMMNHQRMMMERERMHGGPGGQGEGPGGPPPMDIPKVFKKWNIRVNFKEHPYWVFKSFKINAPEFDPHHPDVGDYLREYRETSKKIDGFVTALAKTVFPKATRQAPEE